MKNTKKALLLSVMSLVLCVSMLVGTTFAWFTDSVSTGKNVIAAGNLDIELQYSKDFQTWTTVDENTNMFDTTLWEPGHTEVVYLHITNEGSLALKYQLGVNVVSETTGINVYDDEFKLSDHIVFGVKEDVTKFADRAEARKDLTTQKLNKLYNSKVTTLTPKDDTVTTDEKIVALVVYMPEEVDNVANHKTGTTAPKINLGIELNATQVEAEEDSFDETYDEGAYLPNIYTAAELTSALAQGGKFKLAADIDSAESFSVPQGVEVTLYLGEHTISGSMHKDDGHVIDNNGVLKLIGGSVASTADNGGSAIRNNGTLNVEGTSITGAPKAGSSWPSYAINNYGNMNLSDVTVTSNHGAISCQNGGETVLENVDVTMNGIGGSSHVFYIGGNGTKLTIESGEYIHAGNVDGSLAYIMTGSEVVVNGGSFYASNGGYGMATYTGSLTINGGYFDVLPINWGGPISITGGTFAQDPSANLAAGFKAVASDGKYIVVPENVDNVIATAADLAALSAKAFTGNNGTAESYIIALVADIDMGGAEISAMIAQRGDSLEFLGNGHTISNAKIVSGANDNSTGSAAMFYAYPGSTLKVSDLTLKDITVTSDENGSGYAAAVIGYCEGAAILENVDVVNAKVTGAKSSGLLAGHVGNGGTLTATDCELSGTVTISDYEAAGHYAGKVIGTVAGDITLNGVTYDATVGGNLHANNVGGVYGRKVSGNLTIDGGESIADGITKGANNTYSISNANGLATMNAMMADKSAGRDAIVKLTSDIDFTGKTWTMVDSHADSAFELLELDGQGHTISNFNISGQAMFSRFAGTGDVTIRDITFDNATVNYAGINCSVLTVQTYQNVLLDNVDVKNSSITGLYKVAPLMGTVYNESPSAITATVKNCDISNTVVTTTQYDFCTAGMIAFVYEGNADRAVFENCTVSGVKLCSVGNGYASHAWVYVNDADTDDCFNEVAGVTVTGCTFENK